jgi:hypothetical protein
MPGQNLALPALGHKCVCEVVSAWAMDTGISEKVSRTWVQALLEQIVIHGS